MSDELLIKLIGKLTILLPELENDLQKQLKVKTIFEEVLYNYEVTTKEKSLVASDLEGKVAYFIATKQLEGLSKSTLKNYNYILKKLCRFFNKPASSITSADIKMFMYNESNTKNAASLNSFMIPVKIFFSWMQNEEMIVKNPCLNIKVVKEPIRVRTPLTEEQIEIIRDCELNVRDRAIMEFFLATGCRNAEVGNVQIKDIDFNNKTLMVIGKGNKQRRVYFTEKCKRAINNYLKTRKDTSPYLFVSLKAPFGKLNNRAYQIITQKIKDKAKLDIKLHPHIFRHTFATNALKCGMRPEIIQQLLGHSDVGITLKVYAKLAQTEIEHSYRKLIN